MLLLVGAGMSSANAQTVLYSWESPDGTVIETGGKAVYMSGPEGENRVNYKNADYYTLCVNGKKGNMGKEESSNGGYIQIDLDEALHAGDIITITGYINKDASGKEASIYFKFENGEGVDDPYIFGDTDNIHEVVGGSITTHTFTVPANADGSKFFQMSRNKANTNVFITKLVITKGDDPTPIVTIALPTFEVDGVKYESGATVEGLKTGHRVTINAEDGMYIYANWSSKTGNSKDSYYITKNMKGQTTYGASTSSGGQRVLYAVAGDTDDASGNSSDLAYIVFTGVVAADPVFTPAAGEVEVGAVVKLATECKDDKIFYTTDGSDPTAGSTAYTEDGISINENVTIKAIAFDKNGENGSAVVSADYTVPAAVVIPVPVITPESGATVNYGDAVTITYDEAYILKYTTDGSDPKESETAMSGTSQPQTITVDQEGTFTVKAYLSNDDGASDVVTATYTVEGGPIVVGVPTFDPAPGAVEKGTKVTIKLGENAQSIVFTTDGTDPRLNGDQVPRNWTVTINEETTIKAYCQAQVGDKAFNSEVVEATYTIKEPEVLPESNVTFDPEDAMPTTFDSWSVSFLIKKTDVKAGDKFTFIAEPVEIEGWEWGPQILPKSNSEGWNNIANALVPNEEGKAELVLTKEMADDINSNGGLRVQGMAVKVLAVQFEAGPEIGPEPQGEIVDLIDRFTYTWNGDESLTHNDDKSITFNGVSWGGLAAWLANDNVPADWSAYEKLVFEFAEPTTVNVQGFVQTTTENITYWGNPGITKLECPFEGKDVSEVKQVALQLSDPATVVITKIYLVKKSEVEPAPEFALTFDPKDGTEVEVNDEITLTYDDEAFLLYYTTDGSDPKGVEGEVFSAWGTGEKVKVAGEGNFVIKAYLENRKTNEQSEVFTATYPIKSVAAFELAFDPKDGTEVEVDDEITMTYDDETFLLYYTTDGSDPKGVEGEVFSAWGTGEKVKVAGEGNFVIKAYLENRKTNEQSDVFTATYPIKAAAIAQVTFDPESGTEVEVDDEITIDFDGDNFQCWVTIDGSDPATSLTAVNLFPGEAVKVAGEGEFVVKAMLENNKTNEQTLFTATYPIKAAVIAQVTFDPESGTEVEVDDEITIDFDGDNFQCWVTIDGSDPATSLTAMNLFPGEAVKVAGEGEFVVKAMLENNKTGEQTLFTATYPIKAAVIAQVTFNPESGTEVEVDDEITISFDGDNFQCWVTIDGSDPATSLTAMNLFPDEAVKVAGEGEFVVKAMLENNKTGEQSFFEAIYPIKGAAIEEVTIATRANGYGTYCSDKDLDFSACDAQAFIARLNGNKVILTEVQEVPAGTGILVKYDGEEVNVPVMENAAPITGVNDFIGVLEDTEVAYGTVSILSVVDGEEGFYKFLGTVIPANKAYFNKVASGSANAKLSFVFDDADGINAIVADAIESGDAYNLNGQRVKKSYKGVVIVNGKKYFKK